MTSTSDDKRAAARKRLEERRGFIPHVIFFLVVNAGLVVIWVMNGANGMFWPIFPLLFWGAGLLMHAWSAFFTKPITETDVDREAKRLDQE
jgi:hypothetical protein